MNLKIKGHLLVLISSLFWGCTFAITKIVIQYISPEYYGFIRYFSATVILFIFLLIKKTSLKITLKDCVFLGITGFLAFFGYAYLEVKSISYLSPGITALFIGLIPVISIFIEVFMRKRKLSFKIMVMLLFGLLGVYFVIKDEIALTSNIIGYLLMTLAILSWIVYLFKSTESKYDPIKTVAYQFLFASFFHFIVMITNLDTHFEINQTVVIYMAYLVVFSTVICYVLYFHANMILGPGIVSLYDNLVFIIGFLSSAIIFASDFTLNHLISFILILISVGLSMTLDRKGNI